MGQSGSEPCKCDPWTYWSISILIGEHGGRRPVAFPSVCLLRDNRRGGQGGGGDSPWDVAGPPSVLCGRSGRETPGRYCGGCRERRRSQDGRWPLHLLSWRDDDGTLLDNKHWWFGAKYHQSKFLLFTFYFQNIENHSEGLAKLRSKSDIISQNLFLNILTIKIYFYFSQTGLVINDNYKIFITQSKLSDDRQNISTN